MNKFTAILAASALALTALVSSAPAQAVPTATQVTQTVKAPKATKAPVQLRAYTLEQAATQCNSIGAKTLKADCLKAANSTPWANKAYTIKTVQTALKSASIKKMVKANTKNFKADAIKYETSPRFERDIAVCLAIFPDHTPKLEKKNSKKLSDCINLSISSHYMYE